MPSDLQHYEKLRDIVLKELSGTKQIKFNGHPTDRIMNNLNVSFLGVEGESLMLALDDRVAVSTGSACTSQSLEPSHVLHSMGLKPEEAHTAVRLGFGRFTTEEEAKEGIKAIKKEVARLREISCLWDEK